LNNPPVIFDKAPVIVDSSPQEQSTSYAQTTCHTRQVVTEKEGDHLSSVTQPPVIRDRYHLSSVTQPPVMDDTQSIKDQSTEQFNNQSIRGRDVVEKGGTKIRRSEFVPSSEIVQRAEYVGKDWASVLTRYIEVGKVNLGTYETHERVFLNFLANEPSGTVSPPVPPFTAEEAWNDCVTRITQGNLTYRTKAQEAVIHHLGGWTTIAHASPDELLAVRDRFCSAFDATRFDKTPQKTHNVRNGGNVYVGRYKQKPHDSGPEITRNGVHNVGDFLATHFYRDET
jgi:hypothetical protein